MNNRVDYLSDKLVNMRGKLKNVEEVIPRGSLVNGVSVPENPVSAAKSAPTATAAFDRRMEQTIQLGNDLEQRLIKRAAQLELCAAQLQDELRQIDELKKVIAGHRAAVAEAKIMPDAVLAPSEIGERYRMIDRERLNFFALDARIELLLARGTAPQVEKSAVQQESFRTLMKNGWALALTLGVTLGVFTLLAALIIFCGWR